MRFCMGGLLGQIHIVFIDSSNGGGSQPERSLSLLLPPSNNAFF
jgi:hypothetical protein